MASDDRTQGPSESGPEVSTLHAELFAQLPDGACLEELILEDGEPRDWRVLDVNPAFERLCELPRGELVGRSGSALPAQVPAAGREFLEPRVRALRSGVPVPCESKAGGRSFQVTILPLGGGRCASLCTQATRKVDAARIEEDLLRSQRVARMGSYHLDVRTGRWVGSRVMDEVFGVPYQPEHELPEWIGLLHPDDREAMSRYFAEEVVGRKQRFDRRYRIVRPSDGKEAWVHGLGELEFGPQGEVVGMFGTIQDVTEQVAAGEALRASAEDLERYFALSLDMLCIANVEGRFLRLNPAWSEVLGYPLAELQGARFLDFVHPDDLPATLDAIRTLSERSKVVGFVNRYRHRDGSFRHIEWRSAPYGEGLIYAAARDVTRRIEAEDQIQRLNAGLQQRLSVLTQSGAVADDVSFRDLFDLDEIQKIQDAFAQATGVASIITDPEGRPLTRPSGFCELCRQIRATEKGAANCSRSDAILGRQNPSGVVMQPCLSGGLWDGGTSIMVGHQHVANWLVGQVLEEGADEGRMLAYAREIGADEAEYARALKDVRKMPRRQFAAICEALSLFARQLSTLAWQNAQQARSISEQLRIEQALRESEAKFSQVFRLLPQLVTLTGPDGRLLEVNDAWLRTCGFTREQVVGRSAVEVGVWPYPEERARMMERLQEEGTLFGYEMHARAAGGEIRRMSISCSYLELGGQRVMLATLTDITDMRRAEEALRESERKFSDIFQFTPDGVALLRASDLHYVEVNDAFCRTTGWSREAALQHHAGELKLVRPQEFAAMRRQLADTGRVDAQELELVRPDGARATLLLSARRIESQGAPHVLFTTHDITELRAAERALSRSREELLSVSELAHIGHFSSDPVSRRVTWTGELFRIFGMDPATYHPVEESMQQHTVPEDREAVQRATDEAARLVTARRVEFRAQRPDGEVRYCLAIIEAERTASGVAFHGMVQDLTEQRRAEEDRRKLEQQVMHAQKLESLGVLAGGIAHDFNNLLTGILGNADLALCELGPGAGAGARTYVEDIEQASRRAAELCRQMLAYSGKGRFVIQPLSLNDLVEEMTHLLGVSISKKALLRYDLAPQLPTVMADATQLRQVVMNLITNASEAIGDQSGVIALSTGSRDCDEEYLDALMGGADKLPPGRYVTLEVSDTGHGMDAETITRIFEPFFTTKFTGRGLGLAAVLGIVRGHKGGIRVYSEKGKGTTFKVLLPAHSVPAERAAQPGPAAPQWTSHGVVLVADDEETVRTMARRILERAGFTVLLANDGHEALDVFREHRAEIRLVVLDMTMPNLDGEGCFHELQRLSPGVKVIMTSGYNEQDVIGRFVGRGLAGFVQKPYKSSDLLPRVREALGE